MRCDPNNLPESAQGAQPWYDTMRRCGQTNFNERDPIELDTQWWIEYWVSLRLDALLLNAAQLYGWRRPPPAG